MFHATTILAYKGKNKSVIGGDGQVSFGNTVLKGNAVKIRKLDGGKVLAGFAGSTADAFNLFDMFEKLLSSSKGDLLKAAIDFSKEWRKDKYLRKLEAMMSELLPAFVRPITLTKPLFTKYTLPSLCFR